MNSYRATTFIERASRGPFGRQISFFIIVGAIAAFAHYGMLIALVEIWGANEILATSVGFTVAVFIAYGLNRSYTFQSTQAFAHELFRYCATATVGLAINAGIMALLVSQDIYYLLAQFVATGVAFFWNFLVARNFVFQRHN